MLLTPTKPARGRVYTHLALVFLSTFLVLATAQPARADGVPGNSILFQDLTDTVSVDFGGSTRIINNGGCTTVTTPGENCSFDVVAPQGYRLYRFFGADPSQTTRVDVNIGEPLGSDNPNLDIRSDGITAIALDSQTVFINYNSDAQPFTGHDPQNDITCSEVGGCAFFENGLSQTAGTLVWVPVTATGYSESDVTDKINFQSDANEVPEPRFAAFVVVGIAALSLFAGRKFAAARS